VPKTPDQFRILIVEDDGAIRASLAEGLEGEGFLIAVAEDGAQAIQMMLASKPTLVLLDLMMPRMTGWQVLHEMQEHHELRDVHVFVVTAAQYAGSVPVGYPVWVKPLRLTQLLTAIRAFLR
jgi:DNA-binding response OmpR family regulator